MEEGQENERRKLEELRFAYDQVRKEIIASHDLLLKIVGGTITLTGVIMGFAASQAVPSDFVKGILFFVASAISLIGLYQTLNQDRATDILGIYLRLFLEPEMPYMKWETSLYEFRKQASFRIGHGMFIVHHLWICAVISGTAFALGAWFLLRAINFFNISEAARNRIVPFFIFGVGAALGYCGWKAWRIHKKQRTEIEKAWKCVRSSGGKKQPTP